jgi:hypothetical protein
MQFLDQKVQEKIHWAVLLNVILALLTYLNLQPPKPPSPACTQPAPAVQIAQEEAEQQSLL